MRETPFQQGNRHEHSSSARPLAGAALLAPVRSMPWSSAPAKVSDGVFVGPNGMTLYTFDRDTMGSGKSVCNGQCATNWPPLMASASDSASGDWTIVTRDDGGRQWAYRGKPVYYWARTPSPATAPATASTTPGASPAPDRC
jgi:predicted lipoprotein with Yx(FWY)xxD motif